MASTELTPLYVIKGVKFEFVQNKRKRSWWKPRDEPDSLESETSGEFALGPLDLEITKGKLTSIIGRSGSGKTTLLSLLGLLRRPTEGNITVTPNGTPYEITEIWKDEKQLEAFRANHIGFALQKGELLPYLTLHENAELVQRFLQKDSQEIFASLAKLFQRLYDDEQKSEAENQQERNRLMNSKPLSVSQGQYQRGAIARALANQPPILLADEPTGNLDELTGPQVIQLFREIVDNSVTEGNPKSVIVVTHDVLLGIEFADEIIVLSQGKTVKHYLAFKKGDAKLWRAKSKKSDETYTASDFRELLLKDIGEKTTEAESQPSNA